MGLTDDTRRLLTGYIGEYWIDPEVISYEFGIGARTYNRTFTLPTDLHAVYGAMVRKGEWSNFIDHAKEIFNSCEGNYRQFYWTEDFTAWLFCLNEPEQIGERMQLAADFLKEGK